MEQERDQASERAGNLSVELAAMTLDRDALRQALDRAERDRDRAGRDRDEAERKVYEWRQRAWSAEASLTIRRSLCCDIAVELGCEGLEGDASLVAGLAAIRALKQAREGAR
jgi:hypothetical protein